MSPAIPKPGTEEFADWLTKEFNNFIGKITKQVSEEDLRKYCALVCHVRFDKNAGKTSFYTQIDVLAAAVGGVVANFASELASVRKDLTNDTAKFTIAKKIFEAIRDTGAPTDIKSPVLLVP